jgi:hypothetical protein
MSESESIRPKPSFVPREYLGKARVFREKIEFAAGLSSGLMVSIQKEAYANVRRDYRGIREEKAVDAVERRWRALPTSEQLSLSISRSSPHDIEISDVRCGASNLTYVPLHGIVDELAIFVAGHGLSVKRGPPRRSYWFTVPVATLPLHALGRYFQRCPKADDASLMRDLGILAAQFPTLSDTLGPFIVPTPGGRWAGVVADLLEPGGKRARALNVRTFLEDD